ncbi:MAG TPA: Sec-independent protein translocase protein TatB [Xanthomonadaceae bacterium]|jgi:sec-independent protein translocase protein TatB
MFDFGFGELLLLAVIALVVLGPERLPIAARLLGRWLRAARAQWNTVKAELENEIADEDLRRSLREASEAFRQGAQPLRGLHEDVANAASQMTRLATGAPAAASEAQATPAEAVTGPNAEPYTTRTDPAQLSLLDPDAHPAKAPPADRTPSDG